MKRKKVEEKGLLDKNELEVTLTIEDGTQTVEEERTVPCFCTAAPLLEYNCSNACSYDWCSHRSGSLETAWRTTKEDFFSFCCRFFSNFDWTVLSLHALILYYYLKSALRTPSLLLFSLEYLWIRSKGCMLFRKRRSCLLNTDQLLFSHK